jgi:hypothetical protein
MSVVKANIGVVLNIGNYQSLRLDLGVEDTVREGETLDEAVDRVYDFVEKSIEAKIATAKKDF